MSEVISFRLDRNNPREYKALQVLQGWASQGHNNRYIVTEALLQFGSPELVTETPTLEEIANMIKHICNLLEKMQNVKSLKIAEQESNKAEKYFSEAFVIATRNSAKPGLRLEAEN